MLSSHPYIPNSTSDVQQQMLRAIGVESLEDLLEPIPDDLRFKGRLDIPEAIPDEMTLRRHVQSLLDQNISTAEALSFLGGGCYTHYVPSICDEINQRNEFLTAYSGRSYEDLGRYQALFEFASLMGELLEMDVVSQPTYDGDQAVATALSMASRLTGRSRVLISDAISDETRSRLSSYVQPTVDVETLPYDLSTGGIDRVELRARLGSDVAAIYVAHPNYFGVLEGDLSGVIEEAHQAGALAVVSVDPILLGVLAPPARYGADIVVGDVQALGIHPQWGGGQAGFIATADNPVLVEEYPMRLLSISPTAEPGEWGFGEVAPDRTSFVKREHGKEWVGTMANLWGITAAAYLSLMGPRGMTAVGKTILGRGRQARERLNSVRGIHVSRFTGPVGKEFVVDLSETGVPVAEINRRLLEHSIFGGLDLSHRPGLEGCALICVTEVHSERDLDRLASALAEVIR